MFKSKVLEELARFPQVVGGDYLRNFEKNVGFKPFDDRVLDLPRGEDVRDLVHREPAQVVAEHVYKENRIRAAVPVPVLVLFGVEEKVNVVEARADNVSFFLCKLITKSSRVCAFFDFDFAFGSELK